MKIRDIREFVLHTFFTLVVFSLVFYTYLYYNRFDLPGLDIRLSVAILVLGILCVALYSEEILNFVWDFKHYGKDELKYKLKNIFLYIKSKLNNVLRRR